MAPTAAAGSGGGHAQRHTATVALRTRPIRTERGDRSTQLPTASASKQSSWARALLCLRTRGSNHRRRALVAVSAGTRFGAGAGPRTLLCQRGQAGTLDGRASSIGVRTYDVHFEGAAPASGRYLASTTHDGGMRTRRAPLTMTMTIRHPSCAFKLRASTHDVGSRAGGNRQSGPCACETERSGLRWWRYRSLCVCPGEDAQPAGAVGRNARVS